MIVSDLNHISRQAADNALLSKAFHFLRSVEGPELPDGRITIDGDLVYALVQSYQTNLLPDGGPLLEAHRRYIDIQYVAKGAEIIGWSPLECLAVTNPYDSAKDAEFGTVPPAALTLVRLTAGQLAVLWPEDAHAPRLAMDEPAQVKKIVVKVAV
jgi:YhcH/YjgK/YiaL family protein